MNMKDEAAGGTHVEELLSGYLDGELTQQQRQRVDVHVGGCAECRDRLSELAELRQRMAGARLSPMAQDVWRERMDDLTVKASRGLGWVLFLGGLLLLAGYGAYEFVLDTSLGAGVKLLVAAVYLGLGALFVSVLRQRLIERRTDKYEDVEI